MDHEAVLIENGDGGVIPGLSQRSSGKGGNPGSAIPLAWIKASDVIPASLVWSELVSCERAGAEGINSVIATRTNNNEEA